MNISVLSCITVSSNHSQKDAKRNCLHLSYLKTKLSLKSQNQSSGRGSLEEHRVVALAIISRPQTVTSPHVVGSVSIQLTRLMLSLTLLNRICGKCWLDRLLCNAAYQMPGLSIFLWILFSLVFFWCQKPPRIVSSFLLFSDLWYQIEYGISHWPIKKQRSKKNQGSYILLELYQLFLVVVLFLNQNCIIMIDPSSIQ